MKQYRYIFVAALTSMLSFGAVTLPGSTLQAETPRDSVAKSQPQVANPSTPLQAQQPKTRFYENVRSCTWTLYGGGGASGYHGMQGLDASKNLRTTYISPDAYFGVKFNISPCLRTGLNFAYTKIKARNPVIDTLTTTSTGYTIGSYSDGVLTTRSAIMDYHYDQDILSADLNIDLNPFSLIKGNAPSFNVWLGTGIGYMFGWNKQSVMVASEEEGISQGDTHFNVYNHDNIKTQSTTSTIGTLYVPFRLSFELDVNPRWTIGIKGEYRMMPLSADLTPKGIWTAGANIAYNCTKLPTKARHKELMQHYATVATLNNTVNSLRRENADLLASNKVLTDSISSVGKKVKAENEGVREPISLVFFGNRSAKVTKTQINNASLLVKLLSDFPYYNILVKGFASSDEGDDTYNMALSQQRATAVANILIKDYKIPAERVKIKACGTAGNILYTATDLHRIVMIYFIEEAIVK